MKILSQVLCTFENMENGEFAPKEQMLHFQYYIFKYMIFQRRQKALLWSRGLKQNTLIAGLNNVHMLFPLNFQTNPFD